MRSRDPKTGRFIKVTEGPSIEQLINGEWTSWLSRWPWDRCKARLPRSAGAPHWGRCDLKKRHSTQHALERGFDVLWFD